MKASKVLEMLNAGRIEDLKSELRDEIYAEALRTKPGAKRRYAAMKRYFRYSSTAREILLKPCMLEFEGKNYTSFCNGYSLALTSEPCGAIELCTEPDRYPQVTRLVNRNGDEGRLDIHDVIAKARAQGYKLKSSEIHGNGYLLRYGGAYFRIGLLDITYGIIDDGKEVVTYQTGNARSMTIENDIGVAVIMPVRIDGEPEEGVVVIEAD